jgi:hypothetical protein
MYVILVGSDLIRPAPVIQVCTGCEGIEAAIPYYKISVNFLFKVPSQNPRRQLQLSMPRTLPI